MEFSRIISFLKKKINFFNLIQINFFSFSNHFDVKNYFIKIKNIILIYFQIKYTLKNNQRGIILIFTKGVFNKASKHVL